MTEKDERDLTHRKFYRAEQEAAFSDKASPDTPQTRHPAYKLAFRDVDFLLREERPFAQRDEGGVREAAERADDAEEQREDRDAHASAQRLAR